MQEHEQAALELPRQGASFEQWTSRGCNIVFE